MLLRRIDVALDLAQRDWALRHPAIFVEDRVVRILPALIYQTAGVLAVVFDKAIAVRIAIGVDPMQRRLYMRPQRPYRLEVACSPEVFAGNQNKQWCRIDAAVVTGKRNLAEPRHLAVTHFMQDLAGFRISLGINL